MSLAERLHANETIITAWSGVPDALTVEILAGQGFDAVTLDMQHGGHNEASVLRSIAPVLRAGKHSIVRVPVGRFDMASRALDFGAEAVIAPMVNSVEDARRFAAAMKYPPLGERSWGPTFAAPRHGSKDSVKWLKESNARTVSFAMVETHAAVAVLDGILETPGIDGIFLGPGDFSIAWTKGETINSTLEAMMETVADVGRRTRAAGKHAGIYVTDPRIAGRFVDMGYQVLATGSEHQLIAAGAAGLLADLKKSLG
ncbi:HpcH/HpaI aldolase family protein [Aminobacter aminovorans]|uniref:4-hydroxy-2-oxoheptanedioate aldolase n=1 Tax=Aminobacter aminovorans TaxID=83263 RepID=A0AAC8YQN2_AMIAI|nr:HpcH/HpaI aldolase/citrate lyase family protein [Aminobacter aminovorans]AMS42820.1 HpcH/HpaI aldolase [Aminobacter aminovorans]MBB3704669.1 4-hydroxy-2-oxoheptanedioate aldolase [Aminobacter aminovorans]